MNCMEAQRMIANFINDELDLERIISFLEHIKGCGTCREELEVYYTLLTAMQQLDEDKELSNDYSSELKHKIEYWEDKIRHKKIQKFKRRFTFMFMIVGMGILFGIEIGGKIAEDLEQKPEVREIPSFKLTYSGVPEIMEYAEAFILKHDAEADQYVKGRKLLKEHMWHHFYNRSE